MSVVTATAWCRACGAQGNDGAVRCAQCAAPLDRPDSGSARIGRVVPVKGRLGSRNGIALGFSAATAQVLVKGDETVEMPLADFDAAGEVAVPGPQAGGAAGRLWRALRAQQAGTLRAKWDPQVVAAAALRHATATVGSRRAAAIDAVGLGIHEVLSSLGLPESEICWYLARACAASGDTSALLGWLDRLPRQGYAARVALLLGRTADLLRDNALAARAAAQVAPFTADLDARALHAALSQPGTADVLSPLVPFAVAAEGADGSLAEWASAIADLRHPASPFPDGLPTAAALDAYLRARPGTETTAKVDVLRVMPVTLLDQMIDQGAIPPALAAQPGWPAANVAYLRCRLTPGRATVDELRAAGATAELARRHYLAADTAALAALPQEDPAVQHYRALATWRSVAGEPELEGLRPPARLVLGQVASLRAALQSGAEAVVPAEVAADPTCWPLLWRSALQGSLRLPAELAARYPRFADWLDLCGVQRLLFAARWGEAVTAGRAIAARTALEVTSDEALNMVAFGEFQQGKQVTALQTLDDALGGRYTTGLLVNASIVGASQGSVAALPYLVRITRTEQDQAVRSGAYQRAVDLWMQDAASPEYPEELRALVREALAVPQPDDFHRTLLRLADNWDTAWLAGDATVRSENPAQADAARYRRSWARAKTDECSEDLSDVAKVLGEVVKAQPEAEWVRQELRQFVKGIDEAVHTDFGKAIGLVPVIEALLTAGVLDLEYRLIFAGQATGHLAVYFNENDGCVTAEYEQRMLFTAVREFKRRATELTEDHREWVSEELAKCAVISARAVTLALIRDWDNARDRFNALVERQRVDYQNQLVIRRMKRDLVDDEFEPMTARLRGYVALMDELPPNDMTREIKPLITNMVADWSAEIARLRPGL